MDSFRRGDDLSGDVCTCKKNAQHIPGFRRGDEANSIAVLNTYTASVVGYQTLPFYLPISSFPHFLISPWSVSASMTASAMTTWPA